MRNASGVVAGFLFSLLFLEGICRILTTGARRNPVPLSSWSPQMTQSGQIYEVRQYTENVATVHFEGDGARVTGNPQIAEGETGVILGDSFAEALQVPDREIAASQIERLARAEGHRLNVREYGWSGASSPVYVALARLIRENLVPAWVVVLLNETDLGWNGMRDTIHWAANVATGRLSTFEIPDEDWLDNRNGVSKLLAPLIRESMRRSRFCMILMQKMRESLIGDQHPVFASSARQAPDPLVNSAIVRTLAESYGIRLLLVYTPAVAVDGSQDGPSANERDLLSACRTENVRCLSLRPAMIHGRDAEHRMSNGFSNTQPGVGHLNAYGHKILAENVWETVRQSPGAQAR
jgi:hypothetical protein